MHTTEESQLQPDSASKAERTCSSPSSAENVVVYQSAPHHHDGPSSRWLSLWLCRLLAACTLWGGATLGGQQLSQDLVSACLIGVRTITPSINSRVSESPGPTPIPASTFGGSSTIRSPVSSPESWHLTIVRTDSLMGSSPHSQPLLYRNRYLTLDGM